MPPDIAGKRVLILSIGTRGDVQPFLVLAAALRRAGAEPLLATLPHYTHLGREFGVRVVSILADGVRWPEPADLGDAAEDKDVFEEKLIFEPYAAHTSGMLARVRALATEHGSHVVVVGMLIWYVQWLREALRLPLVHAHLQPTRWLSSERRSEVQRARAHRARNSAQLAAQFSDTPPLRAQVHARLSARFLALHPLTDADFIRARMDAPHELHLLVYPPSLTLTHLPGIAGTSTGFWQEQADASLPPLAAELERFLKSGPPPVCLNFGSMPVRRANPGAQFGARNSDASTLHQVYSRAGWAADMLAALQAHCAGGGRVLAIGKLVPKRVAAWRGALIVPSASHAAVFPRCACVIHHGGAGTAAAAEALWKALRIEGRA